MATEIALQQVIAVLPASDLDRARRFYADAFGLTPDSTEEGLFYRIGGSAFLVYQAAGPASGRHTQAGSLVDDLDAVVSDLRSRGVAFDEYDIPGVHTYDLPRIRDTFPDLTDDDLRAAVQFAEDTSHGS